MVEMSDININEKPQWCPGCGNFGILMALKNVMVEMNLEPKNTVIVSGIGCNSKLPHYVNTYGYEGLHGRTLPLASAVKIANRKLNVIAMSGDGDGYGEGVQHFVHICRRNYNITYLVHNNQIYGLTTGQASPTTERGQKTKSTPFGVLESQFNPLANAIIHGATYVARTFAGDMKHMKEIIKGAIEHKGFSLVDILQPCVTFNKHNTYQWFQERVYKLEDNDYKPDDYFKAIEKSYEDIISDYKKIPIGLFYKAEKQIYENELPQLKEKELVEYSEPVDIKGLIKEFL
ncbi:MAG: thiamine pyrophosphate-dependent enzyme [Candidatus ainarchaeum sp.]|nr:thiamine pyrophosphate-dependent enzyme [Candidatus ainarchaeum sp.]